MVRSVLRSLTLAVALSVLAVPQVRAQTAPAAPAPPNGGDVDELLGRALELQKAGDLLGAIQNYQIALETAPERADIRSNLGAAYVGLGRFTEAIDEYREALKSRDDPSIRLNLALALYKGGRSADAIPELQRVIQLDPHNLQAPLVLADCLLQNGRTQEVIDLLSPRETEYPEDLAYAYLLGTALLTKGDTERGQVLIDRIFSKGESAEGHLLMAIAHLNSRDYQNAVAELDKAIAINPALPTLQATYGRALLGAGDREKAMRALRTAVEQDPDNFEANLQLGTLYRIDQKYGLAMTYLKRAASVRPNDVGLRHAMAATYLGQGDAQKALELLEGVVAEAPSFVDGHVLLATTYYRLKRKEDGDRERAIIDRLNAERQAQQPGAKKAEAVDRQEPAAASAPAAPPEDRP
jgi:tetratricopeptide (TPR) repeat protein